MEEERTNLVPRLQQDAYFAAAQPGFGETFSSFSSAAGGYPLASAPSLAFPGFVNEYGNNSYAPFIESNISVQGPPAAGISNRYLADSFDYSDHLRFNANASLSTQPQAFGTGAFDLTNPSRAEGRHGGGYASLQYCTDPSSYSGRPYNTHAGINDFAIESTSYTNGQAIANNPLPMPVSNNPIVPMNIGSMTGSSIGLLSNIYTTGQASGNYPFSMQGSNNPIAPMDTGLMPESSIGLSPNNYTAGRASSNNPLPMPTSNSVLVPVDIAPPTQQRALCKTCNQPFKRQSDLERHAKKHGPKNVKCQVHGCKYRTYRSDKLREHVTRRHPAAGSHSN